MVQIQDTKRIFRIQFVRSIQYAPVLFTIPRPIGDVYLQQSLRWKILHFQQCCRSYEITDPANQPNIYEEMNSTIREKRCSACEILTICRYIRSPFYGNRDLFCIVLILFHQSKGKFLACVFCDRTCSGSLTPIFCFDCIAMNTYINTYFFFTVYQYD